MKIFAISVVKNEEDIIESNLLAASKWAHKIFVMDNGSTDQTWEKVLSLKSDQIIPWKKENKPFYDGIRGEVFREFRDHAGLGDWWCFRLDADEFYMDDPRKFLADVPSKYHFVCSDSIEYQIPREDFEKMKVTNNFKFDPVNYRYYLPHTFSEARFFRHRNRLRWEEEHDRPRHIGIVYPNKIRLKHYQYRSPVQIAKRLRTRKEAIQSSSIAPDPEHWQMEIEQLLKNRLELVEDKQDGSIKTSGCRNNHLHKPWVYWIKRMGHSLGIYP